jgi:Uma2 family endonuclease
VSPTDSIKAAQRKALKYLSFGTRLVWVVYPDDQTVDVYRPAEGESATIQVFGVEDTLDGGDVLPGFSLSVRDIFPT